MSAVDTAGLDCSANVAGSNLAVPNSLCTVGLVAVGTSTVGMGSFVAPGATIVSPVMVSIVSASP